MKKDSAEWAIWQKAFQFYDNHSNPLDTKEYWMKVKAEADAEAKKYTGIEYKIACGIFVGVILALNEKAKEGIITNE